MMRDETCCICSQILGRRVGDLISELLEEQAYVRRVALESQDFAVIPSLGAIVPGHVILCPKVHIKSFAQIGSPESGSFPGRLTAEFEEIVRLTRKIIQHTFGEPVHYFEHGTGKNSHRVICTVDHAHLHLVPSRVDIVPHLDLSIWHRTNVAWPFLIPELDNGREYIFYKEPNGQSWIATGSPEFESQLMRKIFATALGRAENWNWRERPQPEIADAIYKKIAQQHMQVKGPAN